MDPNVINEFFSHNPIITAAVGASALIAVMVYAASFGEVFRKEMKRRRMKHRIDTLKEHYIVCGFGRVGQQVAKELASEGESFVIIEKDEAKLKPAKDNNWAYLVGDVALDETILEKAQIKNAKAVIIAVGTDADVIFMAISARALRPDIFIVARASSVEAADKLNKIGVNRVALPYQIGGYHMATMALRPMVVDFLDLLVDSEQEDLEMEELLIDKEGYYDGKSLQESGFLDHNVTVLVIRRANGKAVINPDHNQTLHGGDRLVAMGARKQLEAMLKGFEKRQPENKKEKDDKPMMPKAPGLAGEIKPSPFVDN
jgi:voltage-gated potassium channel